MQGGDDLHSKALRRWGIPGRVAKLREEALELALACDRYLAKRAHLTEVLAEASDVRCVFEGIRRTFAQTVQVYDAKSEERLRKALEDSKHEGERDVDDNEF